MSVAKTVPAFLPKRELTSLDVNVSYHILAIRGVNTRFGRTIVVDLEDVGACPQTPDKRFFVYLPKRWSDIYTDDQLKKVHPCALALTVTAHTPLSNEKISVQLNIDFVSIF